MVYDAAAWTLRGILCFLLAGCAAMPPAHAEVPASPEPKIQRNIVYGSGIVEASTQPRPRNLLMDAYLPASTAAAPSPAIIMVFGGAYHRGTKDDVSFNEDGAQDSSMADYCLAFARHDIACFAIEYRLTPEDPAFPPEFATALTVPKTLLEDPGATARIALVRQAMGLPPFDALSREQYWAATFAAVADTRSALDHIRGNAAAYNIASDRIALGGFSAGAVTALNVAYGTDADISAVLSLSGGIWGHDITQTVSPEGPPLLMFLGQTDLPGMRWGSGVIASQFSKMGLRVETAWVPGFGHFYPMGATTLGPDFTKQTVEERSLTFLGSAFGETGAAE